MGSTRIQASFSAVFAQRKKASPMKKLLLFLAASAIASAVSAQGVIAPATGKPAAAPLQAAPADTGAKVLQPDATKPVTKQRKKTRKSTVKLGVKANTVK